MSSDEKWPLCEYADCARDAVAVVHAQWTIFDFDEYASCAVHTTDFWRLLRARWVDGHEPVDVWTTYWDKP